MNLELDTDAPGESRWLSGALVTFVVVTALAGADVVMDLRDGTPIEHVLTQAVILAVGLLGSLLFSYKLGRILVRSRELHGQARALEEQLRLTREEAARFRAEAQDVMRGLGVAIDSQFERWSLSKAEREVALLLLKGLSHKEIAQLREVSEATARQQARSIYKKAGLTGRHDLAAFFLEDLMLPADPGSRDPAG